MNNKKQCYLTASDLIYLIKKYRANKLDQDENVLLSRWLESDPVNKKLLEKILQEKSDEAVEFMLNINTDQRFAELSNNLMKSTRKRLHWRKVSIAACIVLALTFFSVYYFKNQTSKELISFNGEQFFEYHFQDENDVLFIDGENKQAFKVPSTNESLSVKQLTMGEPISTKELQSSILSRGKSKVITPKGKIMFYLNDGTLVHLNADSEMSFMTHMDSQEKREVWLNGEAYFEVVHNNNPFIVHSGETAVEVFGTSFNVDSFEDNTYMQVSLLEGIVSVDVDKINLSKFLKPGNQFTYSSDKKYFEVENIPINQMALWLKDQVIFDQKNIQEITKKLSRWYDVDFVFDNSPPQSLFTAELSLKESLPSILTKLEMTNKVKFVNLTGNKIAVRQQ